MNTTTTRQTNYYRTVFTGQMVGECSNCGTVCVHWDSDDLDDNGNIPCGCQDLDND